MIIMLAKRFASMILIMLIVSFILFSIFESDKLAVAGKVLGPYSSVEQREIWLEKNGYNQNFMSRYANWIAHASKGDFGLSLEYKNTVSGLLCPRLANTGVLAFWLFFFMIPLALSLGVIAGIKEGALQDLLVTIFSVVTTSVPEFASATLLVAVFVLN